MKATLAWSVLLAVATSLIPVADGVAADTSPVPDTEVVLRISDALNLALPGIDRTGPESARWRLRETEGRLWPGVSALGRFSYDNAPTQVVNGPTPAVVTPDLRTLRLTGGLALNYNFLQFLESGPRIRGAQAEERASVFRLTQLQSERAVRVVESYLRLLNEQEALAAFERLRRENVAHLAKQEARAADAQIPAIEVVRARSQLALTEREEMAIKRRAASAELELRKLTGLKPDLHLALLFEPGELDFSLIASEGVAGLLELAKENNPRLLAANLAVEAAQQDAQATRARNSYPSLNLFGFYGYGREEFYQSPANLQSQAARYSVFLTLELPLFDGGVRRAVIAQSDLTAESRLHQAREVAREIKAQIEDAYYAFLELQRTRDLLELEVVLAKDELNQVTTRAAAGLAPQTEPLLVLSKLVRLKRDLTQANANSAIKGVELILGVGRNPLASSFSPARATPPLAGSSGKGGRAAGEIALPTIQSVTADTTAATSLAVFSPRAAVVEPRPAAVASRPAVVEPRPAVVEPRPAVVASRPAVMKPSPALPPRPTVQERRGDEVTSASRALIDVRVTDLSAVTTVQLVTNGPIPRYSSLRLKSPARLVVDLHDVAGVAPRLAAGLRPNTPLVSKVRIGQYVGRVRVVLDLIQDAPKFPEIVERPDGLEVLLVRRR